MIVSVLADRNLGHQIVRMQIELEADEGDEHEEFNEVLIGGEDEDDEEDEDEDEMDEPPSPDVPVAIVPPLLDDDNDDHDNEPTSDMELPFVVPAPLPLPDAPLFAQMSDTGDEYQTADEAETNATSFEAPSQRRYGVDSRITRMMSLMYYCFENTVLYCNYCIISVHYAYSDVTGHLLAGRAL